jgi:UDP-glucose 4-epimerase
MTDRPRRYLVTGGAGFIGSHLVRELLARGHTVRVLDDFATGRRSNLEGLHGALEVQEGDIRKPAAVRRAMKGVTHVHHHAALPSVARSVADPKTCHEVNVTGTLNLLLAARSAGVERFVYASSSSVYGDSPHLPKEEGMAPAPLSPYAVTKACSERYCQIFHALHGLPCVSLRYFNVFGPNQDPGSPYSAAIPRFITALLRGEPLVIRGDGRQTRDFTYVDNVVHANILADGAERVGGLTLNIAGGTSVSLLDLLSALQELTGCRTDPVFEAARPGDVRHSHADIRRAADVLGYQPIVGFIDGLRRTVEHYRRLR